MRVRLFGLRQTEREHAVEIAHERKLGGAVQVGLEYVVKHGEAERGVEVVPDVPDELLPVFIEFLRIDPALFGDRLNAAFQLFIGRL